MICKDGAAEPVPALLRKHFYDMQRRRCRTCSSASIASIMSEGLGVGLYVVKEIIALRGGTIEVFSTEGAGSTLTVRLPYQHILT